MFLEVHCDVVGTRQRAGHHGINVGSKILVRPEAAGYGIDIAVKRFEGRQVDGEQNVGLGREEVEQRSLVHAGGVG